MQMKNTIDVQAALEEGRALQFEAMMKQLAALQAKYKGVRGELLAKVRQELMATKPSGTTTRMPAMHTAANVLPSCRVCGRGMKPNGEPNMYVCQNGHSRLIV